MSDHSKVKDCGCKAGCQKSRANVAGFTLLEVLAALLIMAFTMVALSQISNTNARASRSLAERTNLIWTHEGVVLAFINKLKSGSVVDLPSNYQASFSASPTLSEEEVERLEQNGFVLNRVRIEAKNPREIVYDGDVLMPANTTSLE